jgi:hypothetical protein
LRFAREGVNEVKQIRNRSELRGRRLDNGSKGIPRETPRVEEIYGNEENEEGEKSRNATSGRDVKWAEKDHFTQYPTSMPIEEDTEEPW